MTCADTAGAICVDRQLGGCDDREDVGIDRGPRPATASAGRLWSCSRDERMPAWLQPEPGRLENRRDRRADDVFAVLGPLACPRGKNRGQPIRPSRGKTYLEHCRRAARLRQVIFVIRISAKRWRWPMSLRTRFLGLYLKTRIFLSLAWRRTVPATMAPSSAGADLDRVAARARTTRSNVTSAPTSLLDEVGADDVALGDANCLPPVSMIAYIPRYDSKS